MKSIAVVFAVALMGALALAGMVQAADVVGNFTQVEGRVDLLKGGQLPATAVKLQDGVSKGDVIRTKTMSKAQITFIDNTTLTVSPESRVAIDEYMFDASQGKRNAIVQIFQGVAMAVVSKIFKVEKPDFVIKTHTAVMGVRGTEIGIRITPNSSTFLDFDGLISVSSAFPEIVGEVNLKAWQGTEVVSGFPPTLPFDVTKEDKEFFMRQLTSMPTTRSGAAAATTPVVTAAAGGGGTGVTPTATTTPINLPTVDPNAVVNNVVVTVPPQPSTPPSPSPPPPPPSGPSFSQTFGGNYSSTSVSPFSQATFFNSGPVSGERTGTYPGSFTASFNITATTSTPGVFNPSPSGAFSGNSSASNLSGTLGSTLSGIMGMTLTTSGLSFNLSGPVSLDPNGFLFYQPSGTFAVSGITGTASGSWSQQPLNPPQTFSQTFTGGYSKTSVSPFSQATFVNSDPGSGTRTGVLPGNFTASYSIVATSPQPNTFSPISTGTFTATSSGTVSGPPGSMLTGTMTMSADAQGGTLLNFSGPVSIEPNGVLTYNNINGTFSLGSITGTSLISFWTQTPSVPLAGSRTAGVLTAVPRVVTPAVTPVPTGVPLRR